MAEKTAEKPKSVFETLNAINVNEHTEKKGNLTYLSWAWAWGEIKKAYPDAFYTVYESVRRFGDEKLYNYYTGAPLSARGQEQYTIEALYPKYLKWKSEENVTGSFTFSMAGNCRIWPAVLPGCIIWPL